jgi:hypothetical protein
MGDVPFPPRILIVMEDRWPRAMLRAALLEAGYDAVGARTLLEASECPVQAPERGPVRLVIVDQHVVSGETAGLLPSLLNRLGQPTTVLIASTASSTPEGPWQVIIRRPASIGDIVEAVGSLLRPAESRDGRLE